MANHVHLLVTPARADALAELMRALGARYARHVAQAHGYAGPLWEGRFEAAPVYTRRYVLSCMTYIELNPVRACLVARPEAYRWSSYRANALGEHDPLLTPHAFYCALGRNAPLRVPGAVSRPRGAPPSQPLSAAARSPQKKKPLGEGLFRSDCRAT